MFENQTLNKNRVLPSAMILDRLSIECIAKAATKEKNHRKKKIIESCCISSTKLVEQLVKSEPQRQHSYTPILLIGKRGKVISIAEKKQCRQL